MHKQRVASKLAHAAHVRLHTMDLLFSAAPEVTCIRRINQNMSPAHLAALFISSRLRPTCKQLFLDTHFNFRRTLTLKACSSIATTPSTQPLHSTGQCGNLQRNPTCTPCHQAVSTPTAYPASLLPIRTASVPQNRCTSTVRLEPSPLCTCRQTPPTRAAAAPVCPSPLLHSAAAPSRDAAQFCAAR